MPPRNDNAPLTRFLERLTVASLGGVVGMLILAACLRGFGHTRIRILFTLIALLLGSLLMRVQLGARSGRDRRGSALVVLGIAVIFLSQVSFLILVWTHWKAWTIVWRIWWVSMVPSVFVTHVLLLGSAAGHRGWVRRATAVCAAAAGLMILWLGLRRDLFAGVAPIFLWIRAVPAAGTVLGSATLTVRWAFARVGSQRIGRGALVAVALGSNLVAAVAAFYVGRATAGRTDPHAAVRGARADLTNQFKQDVYSVQSAIAERMGDTRILRRPPFITTQQVQRIQPRLKPGDILLERRNWYLSNPFLPGFWPHAALYVGDFEDLRKLGVTGHPAVRKHLAEFLRPAHDGHPKTVIEAVSEGVLLNSLPHSMHADYVAVLRPRVPRDKIAAAIIRAFENLGKPYDFEFDFDDTSRLVCTQVVYVSYRGAVDFPLKRVLGRNTLPAVEIARKYVRERGRPDRQLDLVLFLDAVPKQGNAREAGEQDFCDAVDRPRALVER